MPPALPLHIFWDWNGTLLDDAWLCLDVMNQMLRTRGMPLLSTERYQAAFDFPVKRYYENIGFDFSRESFETLGLEFIHAYEKRRNEAALFPDVLPALGRLQHRGIGQGVLSAYPHDHLVSLVAHHRLDPFFAHLHGHDDPFAHGKIPQGRRALEHLGLPPGRCVLIGDTAHDADVARELGMRCLLLDGGNQPRSRLEATGCPLLPSRLDALRHLGF